MSYNELSIYEKFQQLPSISTSELRQIAQKQLPTDLADHDFFGGATKEELVRGLRLGLLHEYEVRG